MSLIQVLWSSLSVIFRSKWNLEKNCVRLVTWGRKFLLKECLKMLNTINKNRDLPHTRRFLWKSSIEKTAFLS